MWRAGLSNRRDYGWGLVNHITRMSMLALSNCQDSGYWAWRLCLPTCLSPRYHRLCPLVAPTHACASPCAPSNTPSFSSLCFFFSRMARFWSGATSTRDTSMSTFPMRNTTRMMTSRLSSGRSRAGPPLSAHPCWPPRRRISWLLAQTRHRRPDQPPNLTRPPPPLLFRT